ncbi:MAG: DUF302 domain-containing protein [candidate division Zixibacteria bacterium]|nr:DUF302 domain-containing protein [candidate division Zixibacteria bacterium]
MPDYSFTKNIGLNYEQALVTVTDELKKEGFGVLTEIDVKSTLKKKLDIDFNKYKILGACNPPFAYKALSAEMDIGALLPCNVVIYEMDGVTVLSVMKPSTAMNMVENSALAEVAGEVETKLKRVFDSVN